MPKNRESQRTFNRRQWRLEWTWRNFWHNCKQQRRTKFQDSRGWLSVEVNGVECSSQAADTSVQVSVSVSLSHSLRHSVSLASFLCPALHACVACRLCLHRMNMRQRCVSHVSQQVCTMSERKSFAESWHAVPSKVVACNT